MSNAEDVHAERVADLCAAADDLFRLAHPNPSGALLSRADAIVEDRAARAAEERERAHAVGSGAGRSMAARLRDAVAAGGH